MTHAKHFNQETIMSSSQNPGYAGDISPADAWAQVQAGEALLVDVRTPEEQKWVGRVPGAIPVPWLIDNGQRQNPDFQGEQREEGGGEYVFHREPFKRLLRDIAVRITEKDCAGEPSDVGTSLRMSSTSRA